MKLNITNRIFMLCLHLFFTKRTHTCEKIGYYCGCVVLAKLKHMSNMACEKGGIEKEGNVADRERKLHWPANCQYNSLIEPRYFYYIQK